MTITTDIHLGFGASREYLLARFNHDARLPDWVADEFDEISAEHGFDASLNVCKASVNVSTNGLARLPEESCLRAWLSEAVFRVSLRWLNEWLSLPGIPDGETCGQEALRQPRKNISKKV